LAIRNANLGLSPTNAGGGVVTLGGTTSHSFNLTNTVLIGQGTPGVAAAEPVAFVPGDFYTPGVVLRSPIFTEEQMAQAIAAAIASAKTKGLLDSDVAATVSDDEVLVDGVVSITGVVSILRSNIRDIAGNSLKPNRSDGTTSFTVFVGSGLDYGDAPSPYATLDADNGARHQIVGDFYLGTGVDIDFDGQPSTNGLGDDVVGADDEDGVIVTQILTGGYGGSIAVTASASGFLDAWIDFNRDGDWGDPGEQIFASRLLTAGRNDLPVIVSGAAQPGLTMGRFRFSSSGALQPFGFAEDGEVEDHQIELRANPWRNPVNGADVDQSGFVVPLDALIIINDLNRNGPRQLPNPPVPPNVPPPFLDVNGDGFVTALDVLAVINVLNSASAGEGEKSESIEAEALVRGSGEKSHSMSDESSSDLMVLALPDEGDEYWMTSTVIDHRLSPEESDPSEEIFALMSEFGSADEETFETFAADSAEKQHLLSLADLLAGNLDDLFEDLA
jgi:hypothetical protein